MRTILKLNTESAFMYWSRNTTTVTVDYIYMYCCSALGLHDVKTNESTFLCITLTRSYNTRNTNYLLLPRHNTF